MGIGWTRRRSWSPSHTAVRRRIAPTLGYPLREGLVSGNGDHCGRLTRGDGQQVGRDFADRLPIGVHECGHPFHGVGRRRARSLRVAADGRLRSDSDWGSLFCALTRCPKKAIVVKMFYHFLHTSVTHCVSGCLQVMRRSQSMSRKVNATKIKYRVTLLKNSQSSSKVQYWVLMTLNGN